VAAAAPARRASHEFFVCVAWLQRTRAGGRRSEPRATRPVRHRRLPGALRGSDSAHRSLFLELRDPRLGGSTAPLDLGGVPAAPARAWRAGAAARAAPVLLEIGQVGARAGTDPRESARLLGVVGVPLVWGPLEGAALLRRLSVGQGRSWFGGVRIRTRGTAMT